MNKYFFIIFMYFNLQLFVDYKTKIYLLNFTKSIQDNIDINLFIYYNLYSIFNSILNNIIEKYIYKYYLEFPIKTNIINNLLNKMEKMPAIWIEQNSHYNKELINETKNNVYQKYLNICEGYSAMIRVCNCLYILYNIETSFLYYGILYLGFYFLFYYKIILFNREYCKIINKNIFNNNIKISNLIDIYYNSKLGNYEPNIKNSLNVIFYENNKYTINILNTEILYSCSLNIFQKCLLFILIYNYLIHNCQIKCSIFFLPLYQITITFIYQYEYILHNIQGYYDSDNKLINYKNFINIYNKYINIKSKSLDIKYIDNNIYYNLNNLNIHFLNNDNRKNILINQYIVLQYKTPLLIQGKTGVGKTSLCKLIAGHFPNYYNNLQNEVLYIAQNTLLYLENRTLENIITNSDLFNTTINYNIINDILNIIPFHDIINTFNNNWLNTKINSNKSFSGGQEKRIYLFMWLYHFFKNINKYKIIIFDELEKGLDKHTFNLLINNILNNKIIIQKHIIIISHYDINLLNINKIQIK